MKYEEDKKIKVEKLCRQRKGGGGGRERGKREREEGGGKQYKDIFKGRIYTKSFSLPCTSTNPRLQGK